jgi:hypothetical protein
MADQATKKKRNVQVFWGESKDMVIEGLKREKGVQYSHSRNSLTPGILRIIV